MSTSPVMTPRPMEPLDESTFQTVLVVVAHPDDIEYGLAAAVDRWVKAGKTVTYLLASRGEAGIDTMNPSEAAPVREAEERAGAKVVGVDVVDFLDFHDGVIEYGVPLRRELCRVMRMRRPDCVVSQGHDVRFMNMLSQSDHRAVGLATLDAVRDCGNRWIFADLSDQGVEPWTGIKTVLVVASPVATHYVDVADNLEPAIASLEAHHAYNDALPADFPKPRDLVTMILGMPAESTGLPYSVAFERLQA
ncbi:MAG TPA: PIG-L deacetylase family protein [Lapillicoccus sp.]